ncbi:MAG: TlpA family protein disulfide reductase [Hydrogenophilaceae bacterium]|nr:TlpA family protein disulfide reductase [Hydrogenophilaceae bacterium]
MSEAQSDRMGWAFKAALLLGAALLGAVLYVLFLSVSKPGGSALERLAVGDMAALQVLDAPAPQTGHPFLDAAGRTRTLADFRGRVVLLNVWATNCPPCLGELPSLANLQRRYPETLRVIAVSIDGLPRRAQAEAEFARLTQGALGFYLDPAKSMAFAVGGEGLPVTVIYDAQGRERARLTGGAEWDGPDAFALFDALIAQGS